MIGTDDDVTSTETSTDRLDVSVVICAYTLRRWDDLERAIGSVERQEPGDVLGSVDLVLVIDHEETLLERCRHRWPEHTVLANDGRQGLSGARNTGVAAASGEIVAFLDDDAEAEIDWLRRLAGHFRDPTVAGAGGAVLPRWVESEPAWLPPEFGWVVGCSYRGQPEDVAEIRNPIGANMAFRRGVLREVGSFSDRIGRVGTTPLGCEETELSIRVRGLGHRILLEPAARVHHTVPPDRGTLRYFVRRCWAEGLSKALVVDSVGGGSGLSAERAHLAGALPKALAGEAVRALKGPARLASMERGAAVVVGVIAAGAGFARGSIARVAEQW